MRLQLKRDTEKLIEERIKPGSFASADDVVLAGLKLLDEREQASRLGLKESRQKITIGLQQLDGGHGVDGDAVFEELLLGLDSGDLK